MLKRRRLLVASEVAQIRGCSVRSLKRYAVDPDDDFPKPILDAGHLKWVESDIDEWLERRLAARDKEQAAVRRVLRAVG
jgi:predicted DNA-binding transcriptional regulator AlpA